MSCRKASLALIKKMIHHVEADILGELCTAEQSSGNFAVQLVEVIAAVLQNEVQHSYLLTYALYKFHM
jgi:hypothetical protein